MNNEVEVSKEYSGFSVSLSNGSRRKQRLSNRVSIILSTDRGDVAVNITIREAKALRNFLNENLY